MPDTPKPAEEAQVDQPDQQEEENPKMRAGVNPHPARALFTHLSLRTPD